jgi:hypothetical protein
MVEARRRDGQLAGRIAGLAGSVTGTAADGRRVAALRETLQAIAQQLR